jgi:hypothetical protein
VSTDPLRLVRDALEARDCAPRGPDHAFRARCPVHGGANRTSLSIATGADGRAVVWCHAHQCDVREIAAALGLQVADLFPDGHRRGRSYAVQPLRRSDFRGIARDVANVLFSLEELGEEWALMLACACPYCGDPGAWLRAGADRVVIDCGGGCDSRAFTQALLGRLDERRRT